MKIKLLSMLAIVSLSSSYSEACSSCLMCKLKGKQSKEVSETKPTPKPLFERPAFADREGLKWSESNLYQFFYSLYVNGVIESKWKGWIVTPESPKKDGHSWIVESTENNITTILYSDNGKGGTHFPEDKATFVIDPFSETKYLEGQPFKEPVVYYGLMPYMETMLGVTNEVKELVFFTEQGLQDALDSGEDIDF